MNLLQVTRAPHEAAVDARRLSASATVSRHGDVIEVMGSRPLTSGDALDVQGQLYLLRPTGFHVVAAKSLKCGPLLFESEHEATIDYDLATGEVDVTLEQAGAVALRTAANSDVRRDDEIVESRTRDDGMRSFDLPAGRHELRVAPPGADDLSRVAGALRAAWAGALQPSDPTPGLKSDAPELAGQWRFERPGDSSVLTHVLKLADLDGDRVDEILLGSADNILRCFDSGGDLKWKFEADEQIASAWTGDLRGDGAVRVLVATGRGATGGKSKAAVYILDAAGKQEASIPYPASSIGTVAALDIDGDGVKEIIAATHDWKIHAMRLDGEIVWTTPDYSRGPNNLKIHDVTGDGRAEIISTTTHRTNFYDHKGSRVFHVWSPGPGLAFGDLDADRAAEVVVGSFRGHVRLASYASGVTEGQIKPTWTFDTGAPVLGVKLADLDGSGSGEVLACSRNNIVYAFNMDGTIRWTRSLGDGVRALEIANLDGRGLTEIVCGTDAGQVFVLSADGAVIAQGRAPGFVRFIAVSKTDADSAPLIVAATDGPGLYALKWTPPRP